MAQLGLFKSYVLWLLKVITLFVLFVFVLPLTLLMVAKQAGGGNSMELAINNNRTVAVLELTGIIEGSKDLVAQLHKQANNEKIRGLVLRIDSPGGAVAPSQAIFSAVQKLKARKPIIAVMDGTAASGGLYAALGATKVLAQPGTITGSIGVIMQVPNVRRVTDWLGVDMVTVKSGELKDVGNMFREMSPAEREFLQSQVLTIHADFVDAVAQGRGISRPQVQKFADGRIILGKDALALKLIDGYGDVYDAARMIFEELGEPLGAQEMPTLVYPGAKFSLFKDLIQTVSSIPKMLQPGSSTQFKFLMP